MRWPSTVSQRDGICSAAMRHWDCAGVGSARRMTPMPGLLSSPRPGMVSLPTYTRDRSKRRAIIASVITGTTIEWYDFYLYATLIGTLGPKFFPSKDPLIGFLSVAGGLRHRLRHPSGGRGVLRPPGRSQGPQERLPGHPADHGRRHHRHRAAAQLRAHRRAGPDAAGAAAPAAGVRPGRRVRRGGDLRRRDRCPTASAATTPASSRSPRRSGCSSPRSSSWWSASSWATRPSPSGDGGSPSSSPCSCWPSPAGSGRSSERRRSGSG